MGRVYGANVVVGIPSFGMVSTYFMQARAMLQFPLVSSSVDKIVLDKPIAEARNEIVEWALAQNSNYILWLDDDVVPPPDAFLKLWRHQKDIINGVYYSKSNPPMPLLFRNHLEGPFLDWHIGDLIQVDAAGMGLTLVKTDVYRKMAKELPGPWYSTEYFSFPGVKASFSPPNNTEDLYFYWKAKKLGYDIWADTSVQAGHFEKNSKVFYGAAPYAPQMHPSWKIVPQGTKLIADIGSGPVSPWFDDGQVISFDIREEVHPDVLCDVRYLPCEDETFDIVFSSHTLEHFGWTYVQDVLKEWTRVLKAGGELMLSIPNLRWSARRILEDRLVPEDYFVIYGEQNYPKNMHAAGFTPNSLRALVESMGVYEDIKVQEGDIDGPPVPDNWNISLRATKKNHPLIENITPEDIEEAPPYGAYWPMRVYDEAIEQTVKPVEEDVDIINAEAAEKKKVALKKIKEKANGLVSDI